MATKLFVGGLPYAVTSDQLRELFEAIGPVESADVIFDKFSGKSKGFGFVHIVNDDDAQRAIDELNDTELGGRKISVSAANAEERRPRRDFNGGDRPPRRDNRDRDQRGGGRRY